MHITSRVFDRCRWIAAVQKVSAGMRNLSPILTFCFVSTGSQPCTLVACRGQ